MTTRTRKFIGTLLLLALVAVYVLVMMVVASAVLPNVGKAGELIFYAIAGFLWVPPAGLIISWMHR
jgi:hypothetical protein